MVTCADLVAIRFPLLYKVGLGNTNGTLWRDHRRFALSTLKDFGLGRSILETRIHSEACGLLTAIRKEGGKSFDPKHAISTSVANIICSIAFGTTFKQGDEKLKKIVAIFDENTRLAPSTGLGNIMPILAYIPGDPLKIMKVLHNTDKIFTYIIDIVEDHLKDYDENVIEDYTSAYIKAMKQKEQNNEQSSFTLEQLSAVIADLFFAGSETTTTALRWSLVCLISFPETQTRMHDVIKEHVGTERLPSLIDKTALAYVEAFYMEVLSHDTGSVYTFDPPVWIDFELLFHAYSIPSQPDDCGTHSYIQSLIYVDEFQTLTKRFCNLTITSAMYTTSTDVELNGYRIPQGCIIIPDLDSVMTDARIWGDPHNFRPERFLNDDGTVLKREEFIAFFIGKRHCVGETMARMELFLFLSAIIQNFFIEAPEGEDVSMATVDGVFGLVHGPKPFQIVARPR